MIDEYMCKGIKTGGKNYIHQVQNKGNFWVGKVNE